MLALVAMLVQGLLDREPALPDEVRIEDVPDAYRIEYEVRTSNGPDAPETVTSEIVQVDRPFRSLVTTRVGDRLVTGRVSDLNRLLQFTDGRWTELQVPPAMAASDVRLDGVLDDLVADGAVRRLDEVRRVAGRACQVHRLGGPIAGGTLTPFTDLRDHADVCVDASGLVLAEEWTADGDVVQRRTAQVVDLDPDFDDDTFSVEDAETIAATDGGGSAMPVADDAPFGDRTWTLDEVPDGFDLLGRWAVVWPRLSATVDPTAPQSEGRVAGIATVWSHGVDAIVLEQGGTRDGRPPFADHPDADRVDVDGLGPAEVITDGRGTEVRVELDAGVFLRLWSTLPRATVLRLAGELTAAQSKR